MGQRNLIIIMLLGTLGLRTSTLIALNIEDIDLTCGLVWTREKGRRQRNMVLPHSICKIIQSYLQSLSRKKGPLLLSKRKKRISPRTLQDIFRTAAYQLSIDKKLHAKLFRHTAAIHLNKVAGIDITQQVLGHSRRANTIKYAHLNPKFGARPSKHKFPLIYQKILLFEGCTVSLLAVIYGLFLAYDFYILIIISCQPIFQWTSPKFHMSILFPFSQNRVNNFMWDYNKVPICKTAR